MEDLKIEDLRIVMMMGWARLAMIVVEAEVGH